MHMGKANQPAGLAQTGRLRLLFSRLQAAHALPYLALLAGMLALSLSGLYVHWADAPGMVTSFYRMTFASILLLPFGAGRLRRQRLRSRRVLLYPLIGGLFVALDHGFWSTALSTTQIGTATLINNVAPLWVAIFAAIFWREKLRSKFWGGMALVIVGAAFVLGSNALARPQVSGGDLLAVASSFAYAGYYLVTQRARESLETVPYGWIATVGAAVFLMIGNLLLGHPLTGYSGPTYLVFVLAALTSQTIGYFSIVYALGHLPATIVAPTMLAQPVLSALLAIPFAGEMLLPGQWVGSLAVIAGIYLVNKSRANG